MKLKLGENIYTEGSIPTSFPGFGGAAFGTDCTRKSIVEAYAKYKRGDEDAMKYLLLNIATLALALCDVGGMSASSVIPYLEDVVS